MRARFGPALAAGLISVLVVPAAPAEIVWSGSLGYATGDYTLSETTETWFLVNELAWVDERWSLSLTVPVVDRSTPYVTLVGGVQPIPTGRRYGAPAEPAAPAHAAAAGTGGGARRRGGGTIDVPDPETFEYSSTGVADPSLRLEIELFRPGTRRLALYAAAKAPLADEDEGLSTGEWDCGAGLAFAAGIGRGELLGELGWWRFGDLPDLEIDDSAVLWLAYGRPLGGDWSWRLSASAWSQGFDGADAPAEAGFSLRRHLAGGGRLSATVGAGLTDTAPDLRFALGWSFAP
jgi:hypothetical protein